MFSNQKEMINSSTMELRQALDYFTIWLKRQLEEEIWWQSVEAGRIVNASNIQKIRNNEYIQNQYSRIIEEEKKKSIILEVVIYLQCLKLDPELLSSYALGSYAIESTQAINKMRKEHIEKYGTWIEKIKNYFR